MKKYFFYFVLMLFAAACSKDDNTIDNGGSAPLPTDKQAVADIFVASVNAIESLFMSSETIDELASHLDEIRHLECVDDAWADDQTLFVDIKDAGTIFFLYPVDEIIPEMDNDEVESALEGTPSHMMRTQAMIDNLHEMALAEKAVIINQQSNDNSRSWKQTNIIKPLRKSFEQCGINVTVKQSKEATLDFFQNQVFDYDLVFMLTHGVYLKPNINNTEGGKHWLLTGEQLADVWYASDETDEGNRETLKNLYLKNENWSLVSVGFIHEMRKNADGIDEKRSVHYKMISEEFIKQKGKGFAAGKKPIVFTNACQSQMGNESLAQAFIAKGALCFGGWTDNNHIGDATGFYFFKNLLSGCSIDRAIELLQSDIKHREVTTMLKFSPDISQYGNICLLHPETDNATEKGKLQFLLSGHFKGLHKECNRYGFLLSTDQEMKQYQTIKGISPETDNTHCKYVNNGTSSVVNFNWIIDSDELEYNKTYYFCAYLYDGEHYCIGDIKSFTTGSNNLCPDNNHPHAIDLGLPSGTKWACCNVGASKPEEYGGYYAWGEKNGNKSEYKWKNYEHIENYDPGWFDFDIVNIGSNISGTTYDTALANWGAPWRMPTENDVKTLFESCYVKEIDLNGIHGAKITGPNGNCIFIPSAGYWNDEQLLDEDFLFYLWTGTLSPYNEHFAYSWGINGTTEVYSRECGMSVRAVCQ